MGGLCKRGEGSSAVDVHQRPTEQTHQEFSDPKPTQDRQTLPPPQNPQTNHPGRPIVSSSDAVTENISQYVDYFLKPLVTGVPSYIQDTTDFLNKLCQLPPLLAGSLLVTLDVSSLYTNIPHKEGITACEEALNRRDNQEPLTTDLCHLMRLVLTRNAFTFNGEFFLQQHGTAMGTRMAPSYANLFMGKLDREFLQIQDPQPLV